MALLLHFSLAHAELATALEREQALSLQSLGRCAHYACLLLPKRDHKGQKVTTELSRPCNQ